MGELENIISFVSTILEKVTETNNNDRRSLDEAAEEKKSVFDGLSKPSISIKNYLERIFKYADCSPCCSIIAYIYLDRFCQRQPTLLINSFNIHRLLITSVLVAAKFMDDMYYNNGHYAKIGGISTREMNILEVDFLFGISFHLNVTPTTFQTYCCYLQRQSLIQPTIQLAESSLYYNPKSSKLLQLCFNQDDDDDEDEETAAAAASHQKQQLAAAV